MCLIADIYKNYGKAKLFKHLLSINLMVCWDIIDKLKSLYGEQRVLPKVEKNALLAASHMQQIKKNTLRSKGYWKELNKYYSMDQYQQEGIKAQFQLLKKRLETGSNYVRFFHASLSKSRHEDLKEKVKEIVNNWNEIVELIHSQFPKGEKLKLLVKKEKSVFHFV